MSDGPIATVMREKLTAAFAPVRLDLEDDSWKHAGHHHEGGMDAKDGGESHFQLTIVDEILEIAALLEIDLRGEEGGGLDLVRFFAAR